MPYLSQLTILTTFTLMDMVNTVLGTNIGLIELNPVIIGLGLPTWTILRTILLTLLLTTFLAGHQLCTNHYQEGTHILEITLMTLNIYIGIVALVGLTNILKTTL